MYWLEENSSFMFTNQQKFHQPAKLVVGITYLDTKRGSWKILMIISCPKKCQDNQDGKNGQLF